MATTSLNASAAQAAVLSAGLRTRTTIDTDADPWSPPSPSDAGYSTEGSKAADARVIFHADPRARTVWLVIDRDNAPLTGNYVVELDDTVSTYDATTDGPADVDALLAAWKAQVESDHSGVSVTVIATDGTDSNALQIRGDTSTGAYAHFDVDADTAAPEDAALELWRELRSASLRVWTRSGADVTNDDDLDAPTYAQSIGWATAADIGALDYGGYDERLDIASRSGVWLHLYSADHDDTVATVTSGAGVYKIRDVVTAYVAPQVQP